MATTKETPQQKKKGIGKITSFYIDETNEEINAL
jgi:hypothetical protein